MEVIELPLSNIKPNAKQARKKFSEEALRELSESIERYGLQNPVQVKATDNGRYELISGERRFRAYRLLKKKTIPAVIHEASQEEAMILSLIENVQRENLNPMEAAEGYQSLIDVSGMSNSALAKNIGKGRKYIIDHLALLKLPEYLKKYVRDGNLAYTQAIEIGKIKEIAIQKKVLFKALDNGISRAEIRKLQRDDGVRMRTDSEEDIDIRCQTQKKANDLNQKNGIFTREYEDFPSGLAEPANPDSKADDLQNAAPKQRAKEKVLFTLFGWKIVLQKNKKG